MFSSPLMHENHYVQVENTLSYQYSSCLKLFSTICATKERFYSGKTRQLHSAHLTIYDRLWSNLPYLNPLATVVTDTLQYGIDEDGAGVHDVTGTRCDNYTSELITGKKCETSCHQQLTKAVEKFGLSEDDVHDDTHQYFTKSSPAKPGDYIQFIADVDLLVSASACLHGNVSMVVGEEVPDFKYFPLQVEVFSPQF